MTQEDMQKVIDKVEECKKLATQLYGVDMSGVRCQFNLKGRAAGYAHRHGNDYFIRINPQAVRIALDDTLNDTIPHEIAHIVCFKNPALGKNHNSGWYRVCIALGGTGARTHDLPLQKSRRTRQYEYRGTCGTTIMVSSVIHNRMQKNTGYGRIIRRTGGRINASGFTGRVQQDGVNSTIQNRVPATPPPVQQPTVSQEELKQKVIDWGSYEQLAELARVMKLPFMRIIKAEDGIVTVSNTKRTCEIDNLGSRKYL